MRLIAAPAVAVLVMSCAAWADDAARACPKCAEPVGNAKWKFCPLCGAALPAAPAKAPPVELLPEADFPGAWQSKNGTYRNRAYAFRLTVPNEKWTIVGDPKEAVKVNSQAEVALFREGGVRAFVLAQSSPETQLEDYALRVRPRNLVRGNEVAVESPTGDVDGRPFVRREFKEYYGQVESRFFQLVTGRDGMKYQIIVLGPAEAFTPAIRKEVAQLQESFGFLAKKAAPPAEADFPGATIVQGDVFKDKEHDFRLAKPGADWKFVVKADELKDYPAETAVGLSGPDGLFAVVMVVKSGDDLDTYAAKSAPALDRASRTKPEPAEVDGRRALRVEHRGQSGDGIFRFVQLLTGDGAGQKYQLCIWGPTESVDKHRKAIDAMLHDGFHFLGMPAER